MSEVLVLLGGPAPDAPLAWVRVEIPSGAVLAHGVAARHGDAPAASSARTVLVLPGSEATVRRVPLDASTEAQARAALPHLLDGVLAASDGRRLHYAAGVVDDMSGHALAAAIDADRLSLWLQRCAELGADPHNVVLDFTVWPVAKGEVHVVETPRLTIVAAGRLGGFSIEPSLAPHLFSRWLRQAAEPISSIAIAGGDVVTWTARVGEPARPIHAGPSLDPTLSLAQAAAAAPDYAPNLRQGAFAPAAQEKAGIRLWRFAAVLAVLAVTLQVGSLCLAGYRDLHAAEQVRANAERQFRELHPEVRRIVNLRAQVTALSNATRQAVDHPILMVTDPLISVMTAAPGLRLEEVRHDPPGRSVRLRLSAPVSPALTQAADALRSQGLTLVADAPRAVGDRFEIDVGVERAS
jgi:general secretion pathway protein L